MEGTDISRHRTPLIAAAAIFVGVAPALGIAFAPALLVHAPLALIALNPTGSYLVVVATLAPITLFVSVAALRRTMAALVGYFAGTMYGDETVKWVDGKSPRLGALFRILERSFERFGPVLLVLAPGMTFAALAGMAKMRLSSTALLLLLGQTFWMTVMFYLGAALREWIAPIIVFFTQYMVEATVFCAVGVLVWHAWRRTTKVRRMGLPALADNVTDKQPEYSAVTSE